MSACRASRGGILLCPEFEHYSGEGVAENPCYSAHQSNYRTEQEVKFFTVFVHTVTFTCVPTECGMP